MIPIPVHVGLLYRLLKLPLLGRISDSIKAPRIDSTDLLRAMASSHPLQRDVNVKKRESGNDAALQCLLDHFRSRTSITIPPPARLWGRSKDVMQANTASAIRGELRLGEWRYRLDWRPQEQIDWPNQSWLILFELHRHVFLMDLIYGAGTIAESTVDLAWDFIKEWKRGCTDHSGVLPMTWNDDTVSNRIQVQMKVIQMLRDRHATNRDDEQAFLQVLIEHGHWLANDLNYNYKSNHGMMQDCALLEIAVRYPEFDKGRRWLRKSMRRMQRRLELSLSRDGAFLELTPYYHFFATRMALWYLATCNSAGIDLPHDFEQDIRKMVGFGLQILHPDNSLPLISDTFPRVFSYDHWPWTLLPQWPELKRLRNALAQDSELPNEPGLHVSEESGYVTMRQGAPFWSGGCALMFTLVAGPVSVCHGHCNKLSITLYARGQSLLEGPGYPTFLDPSARKKLLSTCSQNTVSVDGGSQREGASSITFHQTRPIGDADGAMVAFQAESDLYEGVLHNRTVLSGPDPGTILLLDELFSTSEHEYRQHFRPARHLESGSAGEGCIRIPIESDEASDHFVIESTAYRDGDKVTLEIDVEDGVWSFVVRGRNVRYVTVLRTISESKSQISWEGEYISWSGDRGTLTVNLPVRSKDDVLWQATCNDVRDRCRL